MLVVPARLRVPEPVSFPRLRTAVTAVFAFDGLVFGSWAARIPDVTAQVGATHATLGVTLMAISGGALAAMQLTGLLCARIGPGAVTALAAPVLCLVVPLPGLAGSVRPCCCSVRSAGCSTWPSTARGWPSRHAAPAGRCCPRCTPRSASAASRAPCSAGSRRASARSLRTCCWSRCSAWLSWCGAHRCWCTSGRPRPPRPGPAGGGAGRSCCSA